MVGRQVDIVGYKYNSDPHSLSNCYCSYGAYVKKVRVFANTSVPTSAHIDSRTLTEADLQKYHSLSLNTKGVAVCQSSHAGVGIG
jgi:hypothetical protein